MAIKLIKPKNYYELLTKEEHDNPEETPHTFIANIDTPTTYSGNENMFLLTTISGIVFTDIIDGGTFI